MRDGINFSALVGFLLLAFSGFVFFLQDISERASGGGAGEYISQVRYFDDEDKEYALEQLIESSGFFTNISPEYNFGFSKSRHWFRVNYQNTTDSYFRGVFDTGVINAHPVRAYQIKQQGVVASLDLASPYSQQYIEIELMPGAVGSLYISIESKFGVHFNAAFLSEAEYRNKAVFNTVKVGAALSILLTLVLINLLAYFSLKKQYLLYYALQISGAMVVVLSHSGFLLGSYVELAGNNYYAFYPAGGAIFGFFALLFCNSFLNVRVIYPVGYRLMQANLLVFVIVVALCLTPLFGVFGIPPGVVIANMASGMVVLPAFIALRQWKSSDDSGRMYAISWVVMFMFFVIFMAHEAALFHVSSTLFDNVVIYAFLFDGVLLAVSLHIHISDIRKKENESRLKLIETLNERVAEIKEVNRLTEERNGAVLEYLNMNKHLATSSHDIQHSILALDLNLDKVIDSSASAKSIGYVESAIEYLKKITQGIMLNSHNDSIGRQSHHVYFDDVFEEVFNEYNESAKSKGLSLRYFITSASFIGSDIVLRRILKNLVGNAIKYTHQGKVFIGLRRRNQGFEVCVIDTGVGIPEQELGRLEDLDARHSIDGQGFGLGLNIVKFLCEQENYVFSLRNNLTRGSTASIYIPSPA